MYDDDGLFEDQASEKILQISCNNGINGVGRHFGINGVRRHFGINVLRWKRYFVLVKAEFLNL